ncbi:MAG: formylmethanofuran dehydrogenase, partial [Candidatus Syntrophonatronum acetioxidans]
DACGVDAVQVITSCTFGKGNLIFKDYGKQAFTFGVRGKKEGIRLAVKHGALDKYAPEEWKTLREKAARQEATQEDREKIKAYQAEMIDLLLHEPVEDIFNVDQVEVDLPPKARLFDSVQCAFCGEGVMEPRARVKESKFACPQCFEGYPARICK